MVKLEPTFLLTLLVILTGSSLADTPVYDPTDPSQVVEEQEQTADRGLGGPSIDPKSLKNGNGNGQGMMANATGSVESLLEARCAQCHGVRKQKAGVQVFPVAEIFAGSREDWVVIPGSPEKSSLLERIKLTEGHDDIMPPSGPPMTAGEIERIEVWIREGADPKAAGMRTDGGMNSARNGNRARAVKPRVWLKEYRSLDLTKVQRSFATKTTQSHQVAYRLFQKDHGQQLKSLQEQVRKAARAQDPQLQKLRQQLEVLKQKQPRFPSVQALLWDQLSSKQQSALRDKLQAISAGRTRDDGKSSRRDDRSNRTDQSGSEPPKKTDSP
ncbi:MAG: hypothetical protein P8J89_01470 [Phycisphaerales bacterium]|nr:hypothetical protein [Phycisphaerales bacterium]